MKIDLEDVTFLTVIRLDSVCRLENLLASIYFLHKNFKCKIWIMEVDAYCNGIIKKLIGKKAEYHFIEDHDSILYRTKYLNLMAETVVTPFLCLWDADVIVPTRQIQEAVLKLRTKEYDVALPYNGKALDTSMCIREVYMQKEDPLFLCRHQSKMSFLHDGLNLKGGAFIVNANVYREAGMDNLQFYGWGSEDFERYDRLNNLGYKIYVTEGVLFHLSHPRGINSKHPNAHSLISSEYALYKTRVSSADNLKEIIKLRDISFKQ